MALKALLLKKKIDENKKALESLREKDADFEKREADLTKGIEEVTAETTIEEREALDTMVSEFESEKAAHEEEKGNLERVIGDLENDLAAEEAAQNTEPPVKAVKEERKVDTNMIKANHADARIRAFGEMTSAERQSFVERSDVKEFLDTIKENIRSASTGRQKRTISNIGLTVPEVMLGLLRENVLRYSKLYRHVTVSRIRGEGRLLIAGGIPEAVWTECCANLNELDMAFYQDAFGCWKLGGFFTVCNANLEDSDIDLAAEILTTLGQSIGYTDDKTILYGTGSNMPLGIVPRLAQESQPESYPATARPWVDLHTSNIKTIANTYTGLALFQQIALAAANAKGAYARGEKVWAMNETTYSFLVAQAMNFDASGAITSSVNGTMPVLGGIIEVLPQSIIPDYNIIMGYYDLYRFVERAGEKFASSDHFLFLSDQTVFKGTVRWDGKPVIAEAFVLIGINGTSPTASATFAGDGANSPTAVLLPATATVVAGSKIQLNAAILPYGVSTTLTWASGTAAKATVDTNGEVTGVAAGSSVITVTTSNGLTAQCTVTVTSAG